MSLTTKGKSLSLGEVVMGKQSCKPNETKCTSNVQEPYLQIAITHWTVNTKKNNSDHQIQQFH